MSCFSRLLGLICAVVPGLIFLAFSVRFFQLWPSLGAIVGPLYSLLSLITGAICLYLGLNILIGGNHSEESVAPTETAPEITLVTPEITSTTEPAPLRAAPLPVAETVNVETANVERAGAESAEAALGSPAVFAASSDAPSPLDAATMRIRELALTRPNWQVTAPQLAQLANLNMGVADAAARQMVSNGEAQMQIGPHGETIYLFDLSVRS